MNNYYLEIAKHKDYIGKNAYTTYTFKPIPFYLYFSYLQLARPIRCCGLFDMKQKTTK